MNEIELIKKARQELASIGFQMNDIYSEYLINNRYRADLVIKTGNSPYVVVEVKSNSSLTDVAADFFRYHPAVKQAQTYANILEAPFFAVYDESGFYWFTADSSGRPELLKDPVSPKKSASKSSPNKDEILGLMQELRNFLVHSSGISSIEQVGLLFYAQVLEELGKPNLKNDLLLGGYSNINSLFPLIHYDIWDIRIIKETFFRLEKIKYTEVNPEDLLLSIDLVFNQTRQSSFVPRWLADLIIKLGLVEAKDRVLDLSASHGKITTAFLVNFPTFNLNHFLGTYSNVQSQYWQKFQELALIGKEAAHQKIDISNPILEKLVKPSYYNKVFIAPIFGGNISFHSNITGELITDTLEAALELAIQATTNDGLIIFIAPESFLFSNKFKRARKTFEIFGSINGLISITPDAFHPYSALKTSLVIFRKNIDKKQKVFVGKIIDNPTDDTFDCKKISSVNNLLNHYREWQEGGVFANSPNSYLIDHEKVSYKNLSEVYSSKDDIITPSEHSSYPLIRLAKVIRKGTAIKLEEKGTIPVIGPGAIRELTIDEKGLGLTSIDNLPPNGVRVQKNDILINAISTYRGAAALVRKENSGLLISSHVILIRPSTNLIVPEYLAILLNSQYLKKQIEQITSGAVISFIPIELLKEISITVPPLERQHEIIANVAKAQERLKESEALLKEAKESFYNIIDSINSGEGRI